jgi:hypothetical protein
MARFAAPLPAIMPLAGAKLMTTTTFRYIIDPGHGWLQVYWVSLKELGLNPTDFSRCSYRSGNTFYLEEDCDAPKFLAAYSAKYGKPPAIVEVLRDGRSGIRNMASIY